MQRSNNKKLIAPTAERIKGSSVISQEQINKTLDSMMWGSADLDDILAAESVPSASRRDSTRSTTSRRDSNESVPKSRRTSN
ncbi:hypothetical protein IV203_037867 [Nitzschia inconspicua]|uniref:Uncharacterized protein n=1 Tax=Nitzschia inconspicua TaxID=303405 RepID=A0A9K3LMN2_9STRA|nr:hypothetical protein IV203_037867 [Nitzschia inconspicua]